MTAAGWLVALEPRAGDIVAAYRGIEEGRFISVRREVHRRAGPGTAPGLVPQLGAVAEAFGAIVAALPRAAFTLPGGEEDWTVAETVGHVASARAGLALAGALAASGRWRSDAGPVVPGVPGPPRAGRAALLAKLATSQRIIERSARSIAGHESDACPLEHPLVGRLRCGEWLLFVGVHDLMHLDQLDRLATELGVPEAGLLALGAPVSSGSRLIG